MFRVTISLPDTLIDFVDEQVNRRGYSSRDDYLRSLIDEDQQRQRLRDLVRAGADSGPTIAADHDYFEVLRKRVLRDSG